MGRFVASSLTNGFDGLAWSAGAGACRRFSVLRNFRPWLKGLRTEAPGQKKSGSKRPHFKDGAMVQLHESNSPPTKSLPPESAMLKKRVSSGIR
jgi:hypothetical protein